MKLENLLEYQDIDIQLRRQLDVVEKNEDAKRIEQAINEFAIAKKTVQDTERAAKQLIDYFDSAKKYVDDIDKKIVELEKAVESGSESKIDALVDDLDKLKKRLYELESRVVSHKNKADTVVKTYESANARGRKIKKFHADAKVRQDTLKVKLEPQVSRLKAKLIELEPQIDPDIMKQYKNLTAERKYPAFVEAYLDNKTYSCRGCGIALSKTNSSALNNKGYCVCESCRRIIYKL